MRDVPEGARMHEGGTALQRLHEIRPDRVLEEHRHRAMRLEIASEDRCAIGPSGGADDDVSEALLEIRGAGGERDDRHDLRGGDDHEALLAHHALGRPTQADDHLPEGAIVHVDRPRPGDATRIDLERVPLLQMIVEHRAQERMGRRDRMEIASEVQVDVVHGQHLRIPTARRPTLHAEHRTERGLADAEHGVGADLA